MRPPRPAGAQLTRRPLSGVRRPVVSGAGQQLRDEDEQDHLSRGVGVRARPAAGAEGDDEEAARGH